MPSPDTCNVPDPGPLGDAGRPGTDSHRLALTAPAAPAAQGTVERGDLQSGNCRRRNCALAAPTTSAPMAGECDSAPVPAPARDSWAHLLGPSPEATSSMPAPAGCPSLVAVVLALELSPATGVPVVEPHRVSKAGAKAATASHQVLSVASSLKEA